MAVCVLSRDMKILFALLRIRSAKLFNGFFGQFLIHKMVFSLASNGRVD